MKDCVLSPLSFLSPLLLSGFLSACPEKEHHLSSESHLRAGPYEVVVSAADDLGIPCSLDLSGMLIQEKMQRFHPEVQRVLHRAERIACRFYDRFVQERPDGSHRDTMEAFYHQYMGEEDFTKLQNAYKSGQERRLAAAEFVEAVKLSLEHHFPGRGQCIKDTLSALKSAFESKSVRGSVAVLMDFSNNDKSCAWWSNSNAVEERFFTQAMVAFSEGYTYPGKSKNKNLSNNSIPRNEL